MCSKCFKEALKKKNQNPSQNGKNSDSSKGLEIGGFSWRIDIFTYEPLYLYLNYVEGLINLRIIFELVDLMKKQQQKNKQF